MASPETEQRYGELLERLMVVYQTNLYRTCSSADLTPTQYLALSAIQRLQSPKMSVLSQELALSPGATTTLVDRLLRRGLVERISDDSDRRIVCIRLSRKGKQAVKQAWDARKSMLCHPLQGLENEDCLPLITGLEALLNAWQEVS